MHLSPGMLAALRRVFGDEAEAMMRSVRLHARLAR
jgi:hypothetical protein